MRPNSRLSSQAILNAAERLPLSPTDQEIILAHLHIARRSGLDLTLNAVLENDMEAMIQGGFLLLQSLSLRVDFMLVNVDAGRNLLGWQKTNVYSFHSGLDQDAWLPFLAPGGLKPVLSAINNLYLHAEWQRSGRRPDGGFLSPLPRPHFAAMGQAPAPRKAILRNAIIELAPPRKGTGIIPPVIGE